MGSPFLMFSSNVRISLPILSPVSDFFPDFGTHPRIPFAFELVLQGCRFTLAGRLPKYYDHQNLNANECMNKFYKQVEKRLFFYNVPVRIQLCSYTLPCVGTVSTTCVLFSTICSATPLAWLYSWYLFLLCHPFLSSRFLHIYTYVRSSFSGPCWCVWVSLLSFFDARGPE